MHASSSFTKECLSKWGLLSGRQELPDPVTCRKGDAPGPKGHGCSFSRGNTLLSVPHVILMSVLHWILSLLESPHIWAKLSELMLSRHAPSECPLTTKIPPPKKRLLFSPQPDGTYSPPCQIHFCWQYHHISPTQQILTQYIVCIRCQRNSKTLPLYSQPVCRPASQTLRCKMPSPISSPQPWHGLEILPWTDSPVYPHISSLAASKPPST